MAIKDLEVRRFDDFKSNVVQDNVKNLFSQLKNVPFLDGIHLKNVKVYVSDPTTDINKVAHKLFRNPTGMIITKQSDDAVIRWIRSDKDTVTIASLIPQFADIWIF